MSAMIPRLILVAVLLLSRPALAQNTAPQEQREAAIALMAILNQRDVMNAMIVQMRAAVIASLQQSTKKPVDVATRAVDEIIIPELQARFSELQDSFVNIYVTLYSLEDLRALIAFYATPLGQRLIQIQPKVAQQAAEAGQVWGTKVGHEAFIKHIDQLRSMGFVK